MIPRIITVFTGCSIVVLTACSADRSTPPEGAVTSSMAASSTEAVLDSSVYENKEWGYRFRLPSAAVVDETSAKSPDSFLGSHLVQFTYAENSYEIRGIRTNTHETIEQWLQDPNTQKTGPLSEYEKTTVDQKPAYQWKQGLITTFMFGDIVFQISGAEEGAMTVSDNWNDNVFQELASSFQMIEN